MFEILVCGIRTHVMYTYFLSLSGDGYALQDYCGTLKWVERYSVVPDTFEVTPGLCAIPGHFLCRRGWWQYSLEFFCQNTSLMDFIRIWSTTLCWFYNISLLQNILHMLLTIIILQIIATHFTLTVWSLYTHLWLGSKQGIDLLLNL